MSYFDYIKRFYGVTPKIGQKVTVNGRPGVIVADCGHYIGVNFDDDKPTVIANCHPTWKVIYE